MIVDLTQELTNLDMSYRFTQGGETICYAKAPLQMGRFDMEVQYAKNATRFLRFDPNISGSLRDRLSFYLYEGDRKIGRLVAATKKTGKLFGGYAYYEIESEGSFYELYAVGLGKRGLFLCLYRGNELLAIAEKELTVINYQDRYHLYLKATEDFPIFSAAILYYDILAYGDFMTINAHSRKTKIVVSNNQELNAKYDPSFIEQIKKAEGVEN